MYRKVHNQIEYEETMNTLNIDQTYTYGYEEGSTLRMDDQRDHDGEEFWGPWLADTQSRDLNNELWLVDDGGAHWEWMREYDGEDFWGDNSFYELKFCSTFWWKCCLNFESESDFELLNVCVASHRTVWKVHASLNF